MKKVLFIDRDGTLIREPKDDYQVDAIDKFSFVPGVFKYLGAIARELDYTLVMVTNQDGLGSPSFPEKDFWPLQELTIRSLQGEGIRFETVHIDRSFEHEASPYRKPGTSMLTSYLDGRFHIPGSLVIGDRLSDGELAKNLGCKAIYFCEEGVFDEAAPEELEDVIDLYAKDWGEIYSYLKNLNRTSVVDRGTNETTISVFLDLDGTGICKINTGLKFFDHMLDQLSRHSGMDLTIQVKGDLEVDEHHTIEDTAIVLGQSLNEALGKKVGIGRYGFCLPMDDCLAQVAIDLGGRPWIEWDVQFEREKIGDVPCEMFFHFFKTFSDHAKCNLNIKAEGGNEHHKIESIFKALARAIKMACTRNLSSDQVPTTKGML